MDKETVIKYIETTAGYYMSETAINRKMEETDCKELNEVINWIETHCSERKAE